jgi:hypothetical protein
MMKMKSLHLCTWIALQSSTCFAQNITTESTLQYIRDTSIMTNSIINEYDSLGTAVTFFSLIIGAYALYWYKQNH